MTSPNSPFISSPSANNFSSVFVESPDKISRGFERCRPPRKRNSLTVSLSTDNIFLKKPNDQGGRTPPLAQITPNSPNIPIPPEPKARINSTPHSISTSSSLKYTPQ